MKALLVLALLFFTGCSTCRFVDQVALGDRQIIPAYLKYVDADTSLTDEQRAAIYQEVGARLAAVQRETQSCEEQRQAIEELIDELRSRVR